ncbi:hypothetical protein [Oleiagrimonas sp. C23AA]|uniref:hypothetical protein n=1 Tax=Oleiagrimonas sp. C23AA TaxID=2719047 RepID=UPI00142317B7|nr:hypothetical protein [Oleiagrimonas sp. C23AA]NII12386.1 hypothetical protein [Oleiagrimonas sp. C23AA]
MSRAYQLTRAVYRLASRQLLQRLPERWEWRIRRSMLAAAHRFFPGKIQARSVGEFVAGAPGQRGSTRLPQWAEDEVRAQLEFEPALASLVGDQAELEPYFIPWDSTYVGTRYAAARRQLRGGYQALVLVDGLSDSLCQRIHARSEAPFAVVDVSADMSTTCHEDTFPLIRLPAEHLDMADHCAVFARLVLQVQPATVWHDDSAFATTCLKRHGLAMAAVSELKPLQDSAISRAAN